MAPEPDPQANKSVNKYSEVDIPKGMKNFWGIRLEYHTLLLMGDC